MFKIIHMNCEIAGSKSKILPPKKTTDNCTFPRKKLNKLKESPG